MNYDAYELSGHDLRTALQTTLTLERRFSQILGSSPKAEILRVRLDRVRHLLAESDLSLAEVAQKAGFEHPEYMSRLFKKSGNHSGRIPELLREAWFSGEVNWWFQGF